MQFERKERDVFHHVLEYPREIMKSSKRVALVLVLGSTACVSRPAVQTPIAVQNTVVAPAGPVIVPIETRVATLKETIRANVKNVADFVETPLHGAVLLRAKRENDEPFDMDDRGYAFLVMREGVLDVSEFVVGQDPETYSGYLPIVRTLSLESDPHQGPALLRADQSMVAVVNVGAEGAFLHATSCREYTMRETVCGQAIVCKADPNDVLGVASSGKLVDDSACLKDMSAINNELANVERTEREKRRDRVPQPAYYHPSAGDEPATVTCPRLQGAQLRRVRSIIANRVLAAARLQIEASASGEEALAAIRTLRREGFQITPLCMMPRGTSLFRVTNMNAESPYLQYDGIYSVVNNRADELAIAGYRASWGTWIEADFNGDSVPDLLTQQQVVEAPSETPQLFFADPPEVKEYRFPEFSNALDAARLVQATDRAALFDGDVALWFDGNGFVEVPEGNDPLGLAVREAHEHRAKLQTAHESLLAEVHFGATAACEDPTRRAYATTLAQSLCAVALPAENVKTLVKRLVGLSECANANWIPAQCP